MSNDIIAIVLSVVFFCGMLAGKVPDIQRTAKTDPLATFSQP